MVNSFWIEVRLAVIQSSSSRRKKNLSEEVPVAGVDRIHAQLEPYVLLSTPIAEHIRSTVSRADVAVEFSAQTQHLAQCYADKSTECILEQNIKL